MLKLNCIQKQLLLLLINSNTTFVKVKLAGDIASNVYDIDSNTTFVKVKLLAGSIGNEGIMNSNTTFVKVKFYVLTNYWSNFEFKYNIC